MSNVQKGAETLRERFEREGKMGIAWYAEEEYSEWLESLLAEKEDEIEEIKDRARDEAWERDTRRDY